MFCNETTWKSSPGLTTYLLLTLYKFCIPRNLSFLLCTIGTIILPYLRMGWVVSDRALNLVTLNIYVKDSCGWQLPGAGGSGEWGVIV